MALFKGLFGGGKTQPQDNWYDPLPQPGMEQPAQPGRQPSKALSILGVIGDAMQTWGGGQATFLPHLLDLRERTDRERQQLEMLKAKSAQDWADFTRRYDYERDNPKPTAEMQNFGFYEGMGGDQRTTYGQYRDLHSPIVRQGGDGLPYAYSRPPVAGTVVTAPWLSQGQGTPDTTQNVTPSGDNILTPAQWGAAVQALGPQAAETWRRKHNFQIGGQ